MKRCSFGWIIEGNEKPVKEFKIGEVIFGELGMCFNESGMFAIYKIEPEKLSLVEVGGNHRLDFTNPNYLRGISEKFGIGFYFEDRKEPEILSQSRIDKLLKEANKEIERQRRETEKKNERDRKMAEELKKKYPYLIVKDGWMRTAEVAKNLRLLLKNELPGVKVSVKCDHCDCIRCECDESVKNDVRKLADRFQDHCSDYTGDYWDYSPSVFTNLFGGVSYVFVNC